jgi:hypothetical protein
MPNWKRPHDMWDKFILEQANKNHIHQDNLRWVLAAAFAGFFYGGMQILYSQEIGLQRDLVHWLHLVLCVFGTFYFLIVAVESWYYKAYLEHLTDCEQRFRDGLKLQSFSDFDKRPVKAFHPSFFFVLALIAGANAFHLLIFIQESGAKFGVWSAFGRDWIVSCDALAWSASIGYALFMLFLATFGRLERWLDPTAFRPKDRQRGTAP